MDKTFSPLRSEGLSRAIKGALVPPGDKSVSHRALILGGMAKGRCRLTRLAPGADVASTVDALRGCGVDVSRRDDIFDVTSAGWPPAEDGLVEINAANSATTMRLLMGALASGGTYRFSGDASLARRPMDALAAPLGAMGAKIELTDRRYPPVEMKGGRLSGVDHPDPTTSAQVKGAILLAGIQAEGATSVIEKHPTRDHTERLLEWLGVDVVIEGNKVGIEETDAGLLLPSFDLSIPGDLSSASYLICAAALIPGSRLEVSEVGLSPYRAGLLVTLKEMGADIAWHISSAAPEPIGEVVVAGSGLKATEVSGSAIPTAIDEISLIALAATQAEGTTRIAGASELRIKESDRLDVVARGLQQLGASVDVASDGLVIDGPTRLSGGRVETLGDHRMAMTFAVAGLIASDDVVVSDWDSVDISYPGFVADVEGLVE